MLLRITHWFGTYIMEPSFVGKKFWISTKYTLHLLCRERRREMARQGTGAAYSYWPGLESKPGSNTGSLQDDGMMSDRHSPTRRCPAREVMLLFKNSSGYHTCAN